MKFCEHCGTEIKEDAVFCPNCGSAVAKEEKKDANVTVNNNTINNHQSNGVKDNTTMGFVFSIIGFFCCAILGIPGLIISIQSLQQMKDGKISNKNKWMAIVGIVLSGISILVWIYNIINPSYNQEIIDKITEQFNLNNGIIFK